MRAAKAVGTYSVLSLDDDFNVISDDDDSPSVKIDQYKGDELEVWKERDDGFLFVYCNRMEIGYWVIPSLVRIDPHK